MKRNPLRLMFVSALMMMTLTADEAIGASGKSDDGAVSYTYDPDGYRTSQSRIVDGHRILIVYLIDRNFPYPQVMEERTSIDGGEDRLTVLYSYGADAELLMQTRCTEPSPETCGKPVTSVVHLDATGSVRALASLDGAVTDTFEYDAKGNEIARTGTTAINYRFRAEQRDEGLDAYYLRARYYDTVSGRFTQQDPLPGVPTSPATLHRYVYAANDPVNNSDPSGLETLPGVSAGINTGAIIGLGARVAGAATGIFIGNRIANIVSSRAAARTCAASFAASPRAFGAGDCSGVRMPIVFMSEFVMPGIGEHVRLSIALGSPAILNRTIALKYTNRALNLVKCAAGLLLPVTNAGGSCDEYPFASTYQGGLGATVAKVPLRSNFVQGGVLSAFYTQCLVATDVFPLNEFLVLPVASSSSNYQCRFFGAR